MTSAPTIRAPAWGVYVSREGEQRPTLLGMRVVGALIFETRASAQQNVDSLEARYPDRDLSVRQVRPGDTGTMELVRDASS